MGSKGKLQLLNLPEELLDQIISYLPFDEISRIRLVCQKFNKCSQRSLNKGFLKVERFHSQCLRDIKAQLPRRESERRDHPLARHSDILTAIETRLSLLSMTFMKYVDMGLCCFIPGKVIDEIYLVLRNIQATATPPRSHEILQELRDISSMAMEHFDEHIVPLLKQRIGAARHTITLSPARRLGISTSPRGNNACIGSSLKQEIKKLTTGLKQVNTSVNVVKKEQAELKKKYDNERKQVELVELKKRMKLMEKSVAEHKNMKKKMQECEKKISDQNQMLLEQVTRISEQDGKISEISRKLLEYDKNVASERCSSLVNILSTATKSDSQPSEDSSIIESEPSCSDLNLKIENNDEPTIGVFKCSMSVPNITIQTRNVSKNAALVHATKRKPVSNHTSGARENKRMKKI